MALPIRDDSAAGTHLREDNLSEALNLVDREYITACGSDRFEIGGVQRFGELFLFTADERNQLTSMCDLVKRYVSDPDPARPLSLALFGQPGSGKSFSVTQLLNEVEREFELNEVKGEFKLSLPRIPLNLTQIPNATALSDVLKPFSAGPGIVKSSEHERVVPAVFFDEFDAPLNGASFGWLAWFLAPMHDGQFVHEGALITLKRAIYIFAGGTAATMQRFEEFASDPVFQSAKGPDFISRLRGFLNVEGPNAEPRMLRRAVILRAELQRRATANSISLRPQRELLESLLQVGRYRHGARSIAAIVEMSDLSANKQDFAWGDLPSDHLLRLHIDRGPLDSKRIGGAIALSGYRERSVETSDDGSAAVDTCWRAVASSLLREGATLSYAGRWIEGPRGALMKLLKVELGSRPPEPSKEKHHRDEPDPWLESFLDDTRDERKAVNEALPELDRKRLGVRVRFTPHIAEVERTYLGEWSQRVLERFRRRLAASEISVARFVISGATTAHHGRFPGIGEEVMLSLAQGKPIYVAGGFDGAAYDVGCLLGLSHPQTGAVADSFLAGQNPWTDRCLTAIAAELQPGPWTNLPVSAHDLISFLKEHAVGGSKWPENGLTAAENRELFQSRDPVAVARFVRNGLARRFGAL